VGVLGAVWKVTSIVTAGAVFLKTVLFCLSSLFVKQYQVVHL
jgi:hypothetical protein